jgi:hypothetical protein
MLRTLILVYYCYWKKRKRSKTENAIFRNLKQTHINFNNLKTNMEQYLIFKLQTMDKSIRMLPIFPMYFI